MKKRIKIISVILSVFLLACTFTGCTSAYRWWRDIWGDLWDDVHIHFGNFGHPEPSTIYTEEEQVERILKRTEEKFARDIKTGKLIDIHVEIVYSFDNKPEYFLVQLDYDKYKDGGEYAWRGYKHIIGYIDEDKLQTGLYGYDDFMSGRNPYFLAGYEDYKKYYRQESYAHYVVENNGQLLQIYHCGYKERGIEIDSEEYEWKQEVVNSSKYEEYSEVCIRNPQDY